MAFNILAVLTLVSSAMAACPLSVAIVDAVDHTASITVTNTGSEAVTVFKGNTVLSDHDTQDVFVAAADGTDLEFMGAIVNYKKTGLSADYFQTIAAGETVTTSVDVSQTYALAGEDTVEITAIQGFKFSTGTTAPNTTNGLDSCEDVTSNTVTITPDQAKVAATGVSKRELAPRSRIQKRTITYSGCTTAETTSLKTSVSDAISMSSAAYTAAGNEADYYTTWFISDSYVDTVQEIYEDVTNVQTTAPTISCTDTYGDCADGSALLYTVPSKNVIVPCPDNGFWDFPEESATCANDDYDMAGSILHEMTHLYGTSDWAYGPTAAKRLTAAKAADNADTYEMYAGSVRLGGCTTG
ncbi:hypothetical protein N0V82_008795 [Gnomoniopsis sp. IMI 355080]|nr:hypothetical protein N0V82_008795 [Gnomoniopsis sp. IMI 355080]